MLFNKSKLGADRFFLNALEGANDESRLFIPIGSWFDDNSYEIQTRITPALAEMLSNALDHDGPPRRRGHSSTLWSNNEDLREFFSELSAWIRENDTHNSLPGGAIGINLQHAQRLLCLNDAHLSILTFLTTVQKDGGFSELVSRVHRFLESPSEVIAVFTGIDQSYVEDAIYNPTEGLIAIGALALPDYPGRDDLPYCVSKLLAKALSADTLDTARFRSVILGEPAKATLEMNAFGYLDEALSDIQPILARALKNKAPELNFLFHGPAGAGKTELAKTLPESVGADVFLVGEKDGQGEPLDAADRLSALLMAERILARQGNAVIVFDEAEDLISSDLTGVGGARTFDSKVFINRFLESNRVPVIWIANHAWFFDQAFKRRMSYTLQFELPEVDTRAAILAEAACNAGLDLPCEDTYAIAAEFEVPPALLVSAAETAARGGLGIRSVRNILKSSSRSCGFRRVPPSERKALDRPVFDPRLVRFSNKGLTADDLIRRIEQYGRLDFSLLASGHPGTGKTYLIEHLAEHLGLKLLKKRASDILHPLQGITERLIKDAFEEAADKEAMLFFDEVDSLLGDRREAHRSYEVSQTNQLLQHMGDHPFPFACATNLVDHIDAAAHRRFTFKIGFDFLGPSQVTHAWQAFFGMEAPAEALRMEHLAPGDFATVRKKAKIMGALSDPSALIDYLDEETKVKEETHILPKVVGFGPR